MLQHIDFLVIAKRLSHRENFGQGEKPEKRVLPQLKILSEFGLREDL